MIFNRFPGAQLQLIEKDIEAYTKGEEQLTNTIKQRRNILVFGEELKINNTKLINAGYDKPSTNLYMSLILLLNSEKPKDFDGKHEIDLMDYIGKGTKNNKHHIIPYQSKAGKAIRNKHGKLGNSILNNIANIVIISSDLNKKIAEKNPKDYFKNYEKTSNFKDILKSHLIDEEMYQDLMREKYEDFILKRTKKIINLIQDRCSLGEETIDLQVVNEEEEE